MTLALAPATAFASRERGPVDLSAHVRMIGQEIFSSPVLWVPGATLSATARFVNALLSPLGYSLERSKGLEALEFLLRYGRLNDNVAALRDLGMFPMMRGAAEAGDFLEQEVMEHVFKNTAIFASPTGVFVRLNTTDPTDADSGTEVTGGSYTGQEITSANWAAPGATGGSTNNSNVLTFPTATANWGTVSHLKLSDAASAGNMYFHSPVDTAKAINTDDTAEFAAATGIVVTLA